MEASILKTLKWCVVALFTTVLVLTAFWVLGYVKLSHTASRQRADENATCLVQKKGLEANRHLVAFVEDVTKLLSTTTPKTEHAQGLPPKVILVLTDLRDQGAAYVRLESLEPKQRHCAV